jgi:acetyl esterase/lipase
MKRALLAACAAFWLGSGVEARTQPAAAPEVVRIWPGPAPGTEDWTGPEIERTFHDQTGGAIRAVTNVTTPTLTVFRPETGPANGVAVLVLPGGGFMNLAVDHEGVSVARWLTQRGITAFVLKYRVRSATIRLPAAAPPSQDRFTAFARAMEPGRRIAVADALQAVRYLRTNAGRFGIAPDRIGMIGFSAGAMTVMGAAMDVDPAVRPNFAASIYGAKTEAPPPQGAPPVFIAAAQDDPVIPATQSLAIFSSWTAANLPAELHVYEHGGHGFGMLRRGTTVDSWPAALDAWLTSHHWTNETVAGAGK